MDKQYIMKMDKIELPAPNPCEIHAHEWRRTDG